MFTFFFAVVLCQIILVTKIYGSLHMQVHTKNIPKLLEYGLCMTHLAFFGILGVTHLNINYLFLIFYSAFSLNSNIH